MNNRERGFLLLTSHLGNPDRRPLTTAQLRTLACRMREAEMPAEDRDLEIGDLISLGYGHDSAGHILSLLDEEALLDRYLERGKAAGCVPITRVSEDYPLTLRQRLGQDSSGCLWAKGNPGVLNQPAVSLVGSRDLLPPNRGFAREVGYQAAVHGFTLISGNARGADREAQDACLQAGGRVISVVADDLARKFCQRDMLFLSEEDFDEPFSTPRALSRNRVIHALGRITFVAQSNLGLGGTWDGTTKNLRFGWSTVACCRDGSDAMKELEQQGAWLVDKEEIEDFLLNPQEPLSLF